MPKKVQQAGPFTAFAVEGPLDFSLTGILAELLLPLAEAEISVFTISTFDTDWVLVPVNDADRAAELVRGDGHRVRARGGEVHRELRRRLHLTRAVGPAPGQVVRRDQVQRAQERIRVRRRLLRVDAAFAALSSFAALLRHRWVRRGGRSDLLRAGGAYAALQGLAAGA